MSLASCAHTSYRSFDAILRFSYTVSITLGSTIAIKSSTCIFFPRSSNILLHQLRLLIFFVICLVHFIFLTLLGCLGLSLCTVFTNTYKHPCFTCFAIMKTIIKSTLCFTHVYWKLPLAWFFVLLTTLGTDWRELSLALGMLNTLLQLEITTRPNCYYVTAIVWLVMLLKN